MSTSGRGRTRQTLGVIDVVGRFPYTPLRLVQGVAPAHVEAGAVEGPLTGVVPGYQTRLANGIILGLQSYKTVGCNCSDLVR